MKHFTKKELDERLFPLYETSIDGNGEYLLPSSENHIVYDFDKLVELVGKKYRHNKIKKSADAFFINKKDEYFLIEFKNTHKNHMPKNELFFKAYDSILPIQLLFCKDISLEDLCQKLVYIVVYNNNIALTENSSENPSESFENFGSTLANLACIDKKQEILWGLDIYKNVFFKEIYTVEKQDFIKNIKPLIFP